MKSLHATWLALVCASLSSATLAGGHSSEAPSGQAVFEESCANCHDSFINGFVTGAPQLGDEDEWAVLAAKGIDGLTDTTIAGIGEMAARGGCAECSDEEIRAAIQYILDESQ